MSGGDSPSNENLRGLAKYFNSETNFGRANVAKVTYATIALIIAYNMMKPKNKK